MVAFGTAAIAFAEVGWLVPLMSGRFAAAVGLAVGAFVAARDAAGYEPLAFVAAGVLLALGIWRATFIYLFAGVALLFVSLIASIIEHVEDPSAQAGALIVLGALLVAVVLSLARWQPWKQAAV
jgi:hypothetical protein